METLAFIFQFLIADWQSAITGGIIVACAVIFIMGILKKAFLGKIKNKLLRKVVLSFLSVILTFPATAIYFISDNISFDYYWYALPLMCIMTILVYWLYENTGLRNVIAWIGHKTVGKFASVFITALVTSKGVDETKDVLTMTTAELKDEVKKELKKQIKEDSELKGL